SNQNQLYENGWHIALRLFHDDSTLQAGAALIPSESELQNWADSVLQHCGRIGAVARYLEFVQVGLMSLERRSENEFAFKFIATNVGQEFLERVDFEYVANLRRRLDSPYVEQLVKQHPAMLHQMESLVDSWREHYIQYTAHPDLDDFYAERAKY